MQSFLNKKASTFKFKVLTINIIVILNYHTLGQEWIITTTLERPRHHILLIRFLNEKVTDIVILLAIK